MNYRHHYHAGIFADIYKHLILLNLIHYLQKKDNPLCFMDTHAGIGLYNLTHTAAVKTKEYETGFSKILVAAEPPPLVTEFLNLIKQLPENQHATHMHFYAGSPLIMSTLLRPQDRLIACELHGEDYQHLKYLFARNKQVQVHYTDGYQALNAFAPPKENRGLALIDPSYEKPDEYEQIQKALEKSLKKWPTGMYALWYPIKKNQSIPESLIETIKPLCKTILKKEFFIYDVTSPVGLNGCGMLLINPPWDFDDTFAETEAWLNKVLKM